jgi:hypothetical protein
MGIAWKDYSTDQMADRYGDWLSLNGLPQMSADELLHEDITDEQRKWLTVFCEAWREAEAHEGGGSGVFDAGEAAPRVLSDAERLTGAFCALVRRDLGEHIAEINRRNATPDYAGACATNDFIDANMLMHEAFEVAFGREPMVASNIEPDTRLWNEAWAAARARGFARSEDEPLWPASVIPLLLHVYGQEGPHDPVEIAGTPEAIRRLGECLLSVADAAGDPEIGMMTKDGEHYRIVCRIDIPEVISDMPLPYAPANDWEAAI